MINTSFKQENVIIYELVLPYCTVCTPANGFGENQWHTPVTCEETSDSEYSLFFVDNKAPAPMQQPHAAFPGEISKMNSKVFHAVNSSTSSTAMLKPGEGLASRSTIGISMSDFDGDPGPINFTDKGTFFGKLRARNVLIGKKIISHYYTRVNQNDPLQFVDSSTHFITSTDLTNGTFKVNAKDALKDIEALSNKFPEPSEIELAEDIDSSVTSFEISDASGLSNGDTIRIEKELLRLNADPVGNIISTYARGQGFSVDDIIVYKTAFSSHSAGATVQPCYLMLGSRIYDVLLDLFNSAGLGAYTNYDQWKAEIDEWNSDAKLYGVFHQSDSYEDRINSILSKYMIDMWLDQTTQNLVASATTVWKEEKRQIVEGDDFSDLSTKDLPTSRYSRAMIYNYKEYKTEDTDPVNYAKLILRTDVEKETSDFYGDIKLKEFDPSEFMTNGDAISLCQRYIQRFSSVPRQLTFTMEERKLADTKLGDVVEVISRNAQTAEGLSLTASDRVQITRIQPNLNTIGRQYKVTGLSYVPQITSDGGSGEYTITLSGNLFDVDLFAEAGKPNVAVNMTFVFDGATIGSTSTSFYSMSAAGFAEGSRIRIILINDTIWSAIGGNGGDAYGRIQQYPPVTITSTTDGANGGNSYNSSGIETEIYINYPSIDTYSAQSAVFASGGGSPGVAAAARAAVRLDYVTAMGVVSGSGGSGIPGGIAGNATQGGNYWNRNDSVYKFGMYSGNNGNSLAGGEAVSFYGNAYLTGSVGAFGRAIADVNNGGGGNSTDAGAATSIASTDSNSSNGQYSSSSKGQEGLAGYAFVGDNITVFNTDSSKLRDGRNNGSGYTLITE